MVGIDRGKRGEDRVDGRKRKKQYIQRFARGASRGEARVKGKKASGGTSKRATEREHHGCGTISE